MSTRTAARKHARPAHTALPEKKLEARPGPRQDRGQKRFNELLDAAELVIADVGVDAMTTNAVAERAGAGMGSLYHFFANKEAIVEALAARYVQAMCPVTPYSANPELARMPLAAMADAIVDPLVQLFGRFHAYRHVFHAVNETGTPCHCESNLQDSVVDKVEGLMAARTPSTDPRQRRVYATVAVELVHAMLDAAFRAPVAHRQPIIDEAKRLLALYSEMIEKNDDPLTRLR